MPIYVAIGYPDHSEPHRFKIGSTERVMFLFFRGKMPAAIEFYHKPRFSCVEIDDVFADDLLPLKSHGMMT